MFSVCLGKEGSDAALLPLTPGYHSYAEIFIYKDVLTKFTYVAFRFQSLAVGCAIAIVQVLLVAVVKARCLQL